MVDLATEPKVEDLTARRIYALEGEGIERACLAALCYVDCDVSPS